MNPSQSSASTNAPVSSMSPAGYWLVLITAFLGWMCAGWQLAISSLAMREAARDLLLLQAGGSEVPEQVVGRWFGWLTCAFLLGAASGGYFLGWVGDRVGRTKAMALSILCYSVFSALSPWARSPEELLCLRFLCCLGVGGMWPNGIALVSEAWPNISRPVLAGAVGTSANLGISILSEIARHHPVKVDDWHWIMYFGATPAVLGLLTWLIVPESPNWLAQRRREPASGGGPPPTSLAEIFQPPLLRITLLGIILGTIPMFGGWGNSNWVMPWASKVGEQLKDATLTAELSLARSVPGTISSLLGGGVAALLGRRRSYFLFSATALVSAEILFCFLTPGENRGWFIFWYGALGFFSGFYFGWMPLCLPELFPLRVRSMGAGVSFNWGRIVTAIGVLSASSLLGLVQGDYAQIGRITSLMYAVGLVVIWFMPDTSQRSLKE